MQSEEQAVQCGYRNGDTREQCQNEGSYSFPVRDASNIPDGTICLCEYHLGLLVGYAADKLPE